MKTEVAREGGPAERLIRDAEIWGAHNYRPLPVVLTRGEGIWVWDVEGRRYLDMLAAYSALNHGHGHPRIVAALVEQASRLALTSRAFHNDQYAPFLRELCELTGYDKALPMNTGAEAVETAIKAARKWGYERKGVPRDQAEIVVCEGNFHGGRPRSSVFRPSRPTGTGSGRSPRLPPIPYGDADALEDAITDRTVAFLVEPIQGSGRGRAPDGYLSRAARSADGERPAHGRRSRRG